MPNLVTTRSDVSVRIAVGEVVYFEEPESSIWVAWDMVELTAKVYEYVCDRWQTYFLGDEDYPEPPPDHDTAVNLYFEAACDSEKFDSWYTYLPHPMPADAVVELPSYRYAAQEVTGFADAAPGADGDALSRLD